MYFSFLFDVYDRKKQNRFKPYVRIVDIFGTMDIRDYLLKAKINSGNIKKGRKKNKEREKKTKERKRERKRNVRNIENEKYRLLPSL